MKRNIQAVLVIVVIITVLAPFLASLAAGANRLFKRLFPPFKGVVEANRGASKGCLLCPPIPAGIALENEVESRLSEPSLKWFWAKKVMEISLKPLLVKELCTQEDTLPNFHLGAVDAHLSSGFAPKHKSYPSSM